MSEVSHVAQDSDGFIWVGTRSGLVRYDGHEVVPWAPGVLSGHITILAAGPGDELIIGIERGRIANGREKTHLFRALERDVEPVAGPEGTPLQDATAARFSADGSLWVVRHGKALRRDAGGHWTILEVPGEEIYGLGDGPASSMLAITANGVWEMGYVPGAGARRLIEQRETVVALAAPDGAVYAARIEGGGGRLLRAKNGRVREILHLQARPIELVLRGKTLWSSWDRYLLAIRQDEPPEVIGPEDGLHSGGPLLVDDEGSLWLGTYEGLVHFPEPDTVIWTDTDGLPSRHLISLAPVRPEMTDFWISSWQGLGRMTRAAGGWRAVREKSVAAESLCPDQWGRTWSVNTDMVREFVPGRMRVHSFPGLLWPGRCSVAPDGTTWLLTNKGILHAPAEGRVNLVLPQLPFGPAPTPGAILLDRRDRLWVSAEEAICQASASQVLGGGAAPWSCSTLPHTRTILSLMEDPAGTIWAATTRGGVWQTTGGGWTQVPGSARPPYQNFGGLRLSKQGGVWLLSEGGVARVTGSAAVPAGWEVKERMSSWQGVPPVSSTDLLEEADGSLWIASIAGLIQVPATARQAAMGVPRVKLVGIALNGAPTGLESDPRLAPRHSLELRFAALSYRDPTRLRYQVRVHPDDPWREISGPPILRYIDLGAGSYRVEVRASLDGSNWSNDAAQFAFEVLPPWYRRGWAIVLLGLAVVTLLSLAQWLRVAMQLRLERQRARIAMDLHDEMGSGLGSIRILAGLAAEVDAPGRERATLAQIAETAGELGGALSEIVWSLRPGSGRMAALAGHLVERGARLFPGDAPAFRADIPESLPHIELSLSTRRNVVLIALEAMHNAARHAKASCVTLGLAPQGRKWRLWVCDDGQGMGEGGPPESGMGLRNMRQRAGEIGAEIRWLPRDGGGTCVTLLFDPRASARRG